MIKHYQDDADDDELRELLRPLRDVQAPAGLVAKCLDAAGDSIESTPAATQVRPVADWRSRLYVPVAIAATLLIGISTGWIARGQVDEAENVSQSLEPAEQPTVPTPVFRQAMPGELVHATSVVDYQEEVGNPVFVTQEFYLCGVGRIQSKSQFQLKGESP